MKALSKTHAKPGIWMIDAPKPTIGDQEVLVQMLYTAICGTDIHIYQWDEWSQKTIPVPLITGHEFVGKIVEIGKAITHYQVGDIVSGEGRIPCGHCTQCRTQNFHLCPHAKRIGVNHPGCFAEFMALPESNVVKIPSDVPLEVAAVFDPLGNAIHTALMFDCVGEDVLITGAGPIGVMAGLIAQKVGARRVVITDISPYRLDLAKKLGLEAVAADKLDPKYQCKVGMEMSGNPKALNTLIQQTERGGNIALLGIAPTCSIDWSEMIFKGLALKGISGRILYTTWHKMIRLVQAGLPVQSIITHQFPADDYQQAFELACSGQAGKILLKW